MKLTFIVESVYSVDAGALVVSAQKEKVFWIFDFIGEEEADGLERLFASVHVVSEKEVV